MARLRYNGLSTTLGAGLTSSATAITFGAALTHSGGTNVPTIAGSDYIPLTILDSVGKASEIVYLTAYTSGATSGTITRAQEGTTGVVHASGDKVAHGPTVADIAGHGAKVTNSTATQAFTNASVTSTTWQTEQWDTDNYWVSGSPTRFTIPAGMGGLYLLIGHFTLDDGVSFDQLLSFAVNGTEKTSTRSRVTSTFAHLASSTVLMLADADYVEMKFYQASGATKNSPATAGMNEFSIQKVG